MLDWSAGTMSGLPYELWVGGYDEGQNAALESGNYATGYKNMKYYFKSKLRYLSKSSNIYKDVTENFLLFTVPNNHNISFAKEIIVNGKTYKLNNQNKFNFRNNEINVAFWLINTIGGKVELRFEIGEERNIISADYNFLSEPLDLKEIKRGASKYTFDHLITKQAKSFIMDVTNNNNMTDELINENLNHLFKFKTDLNYIIVKRDNNLLGIYKRK